MLRLVVAAFSVVFAVSQVQAQSTTVVELYTSQGCSSCPPADALLHELAERDDVIALALHVDYWDYIGWKDVFADAAYAKRQRAYARAAGQKVVYTPQMVIGGVDHVIGTRPKDVAAALSKHNGAKPLVEIAAERTDQMAQMTLVRTADAAGPMVVQIVTYIPREKVQIKRGENAGRTLEYANIVRSWSTVKVWEDDAPLSLETKIPRQERAVVIVQAPDFGPIVASARLD